MPVRPVDFAPTALALHFLFIVVSVLLAAQHVLARAHRLPLVLQPLRGEATSRRALGHQGRLAGELGLNELLQHRAVQPRGGPGPRDLVGVQGPPEACDGGDGAALAVQLALQHGPALPAIHLQPQGAAAQGSVHRGLHRLAADLVQTGALHQQAIHRAGAGLHGKVHREPHGEGIGLGTVLKSDGHAPQPHQPRALVHHPHSAPAPRSDHGDVLHAGLGGGVGRSPLALQQSRGVTFIHHSSVKAELYCGRLLLLLAILVIFIHHFLLLRRLLLIPEDVQGHLPAHQLPLAAQRHDADGLLLGLGVLLLVGIWLRLPFTVCVVFGAGLAAIELLEELFQLLFDVVLRQQLMHAVELVLEATLFELPPQLLVLPDALEELEKLLVAPQHVPQITVIGIQHLRELYDVVIELQKALGECVPVHLSAS
mmetsp:Transcript_106088/g.253249  ORF Transcript_106088/g.253249 Transcript_106088/m.253249 type:complete len:426 (+) Transcript_106088:1657-2934(+)